MKISHMFIQARQVAAFDKKARQTGARRGEYHFSTRNEVDAFSRWLDRKKSGRTWLERLCYGLIVAGELQKALRRLVWSGQVGSDRAMR